MSEELRYFRNQFQREGAYRVVIVMLCILAIAGPIAMAIVLRQEQRMLVMDQAGNYHLVVGRDMRDVRKLHHACATAAATALLTRTPDGYLYKDLLYQTFTSQCKGWLENHLQETSHDFQLKNMRQIPEVKEMQILDKGNGKFEAHLKVYLTQACQYMGIPSVDNANLLLSFRMAANPDISSNGRLPLIVYQVTRYDLKPIKAGK